MTYSIHRAAELPPLEAGWNDPAWSAAAVARLEHFRPESSTHRPAAAARLLHDENALRGIFRVEDQYVRSVRTRYMDEVWKDSCVEVFLQPRAEGGYFNLEMNAGGAHLCCYIEDPARVPGGFKRFVRLPEEIGRQIQVKSSLPAVVDPEAAGPLAWELNFLVPFFVLTQFAGPIGREWRGNFYKCADETSHPHWASWSPVDELNFHLPRCFGILQLL